MSDYSYDCKAIDDLRISSEDLSVDIDRYDLEWLEHDEPGQKLSAEEIEIKLRAPIKVLDDVEVDRKSDKGEEAMNLEDTAFERYKNILKSGGGLLKQIDTTLPGRKAN